MNSHTIQAAEFLANEKIDMELQRWQKWTVNDVDPF